MPKLPLVIYPDAILKNRSTDVTEIGGELVQFCADMVETMYASHGVGLAAPQVGSNIRIITVDVEQEPPNGETLLTLINPVIVESHGRTTYEEGCLSFPGFSADIRRKDQIHVKAYSPEGKEIDLEAEGLLSICIQHEVDHLNGVTFLDRLNPIQRKLAYRRYMQIRREDEDRAADEAILAIHDR